MSAPDSNRSGGGGKRLNNLPKIIAIGAVVLVVFVMLMMVMGRKKKDEVAATPNGGGGGSLSDAKDLTKNLGGYEPPTPPPPPPATLLPPAVQPAPGAPIAAVQQPEDPDIQRIKQVREQMFQDGLKAKTIVNFNFAQAGSSAGPGVQYGGYDRDGNRRSSVDQQAPEKGNEAYAAGGYGGYGAGYGGGGYGYGYQPMPPPPPSSVRNKLSDYDNEGDKDDRWKMDTKMDTPSTPYLLRAGFVVPATLISGLNSELPGTVMAQVGSDVYDTAVGTYVLIPQGSRLVGSYSSNVVLGQSRVFVAWQRIVFPDGKALDIGSMPGADGIGYAGFSDKVDRHFWRIMSQALMMSLVTAGVTYSQDSNSSDSGDSGDDQTASGAMSEALGQQLGQVSAQLIGNSMTISPTLEIRPGYRFNIVVVKDLAFSKPYQSFDY